MSHVRCGRDSLLTSAPPPLSSQDDTSTALALLKRRRAWVEARRSELRVEKGIAPAPEPEKVPKQTHWDFLLMEMVRL